MTNNLIFEGRCWKFGDDVSNDDGLMDRTFFRSRIFDAEALAPHVLEPLSPAFAKDAQAGDVIVAGQRFCHGNPHPQGCMGLKQRGVAAIIESVQNTPYRLMVTMGVAFLPFAKGVTKLVNDGDHVRLNVVTGLFENLTSGKAETYEPLPEFLIDIISNGGSKDHVQKRLVEAGKIPA
jgi:3-isopropylmalate/(R)-2-methylmalate dehydratase small subunit